MGNPLADLDDDGHSALVEYAFGTSDSVSNPATDFLTPNGPDGTILAMSLPNADCAIVEFEGSEDLVEWSSGGGISRAFWRYRVTLREVSSEPIRDGPNGFC